MKAILDHITRARLLLSMAAGALLLSSCGVNEPESTPWQDVSNFSWPTRPGTFMRYSVEDKLNSAAGITHEIQSVDQWVPTGGPFQPQFLTSEDFPGQQVYVLSDSAAGPVSNRYFLPMKDTLVVDNDPTGAHFALVAPLERNRTWIASNEPRVQATLLERFSELKLKGKTYKNVIVVKYESDENYYVRFYAEQIGPILTKQYDISTQDKEELITNDPQAIKTTTLEMTTATQN